MYQALCLTPATRNPEDFNTTKGQGRKIKGTSFKPIVQSRVIVNGTCSPRTGFLNLGTIDILGQIILCCEELCTVRCLGIDIYPLGSSSIPFPAILHSPVVTQTVSRHCQVSPGVQNCPPGEKHFPRDLRKIINFLSLT